MPTLQRCLRGSMRAYGDSGPSHRIQSVAPMPFPPEMPPQLLRLQFQAHSISSSRQARMPQSTSANQRSSNSKIAVTLAPAMLHPTSATALPQSFCAKRAQQAARAPTAETALAVSCLCASSICRYISLCVSTLLCLDVRAREHMCMHICIVLHGLIKVACPVRTSCCIGASFAVRVSDSSPQFVAAYCIQQLLTALWQHDSTGPAAMGMQDL